MESNIRIDKFLWSVRIYKTRNEATIACRNEHVIINDVAVKPSRIIKSGDVIEIKINPIIKKIKVIIPLSNRCSNALTVNYIEDLTPASELEKLRLLQIMKKQNNGNSRPTKKDRRKRESSGLENW